jgi:chromosome segregation ATPase
MDQELLQYLEERFGEVHSQFDTVNQRLARVERRLDSHDQRFSSIDRRFDSMDQRFDELKRHTGVLVEGLHHEVHLLADSLGTHVEAEHVRHQAIQEQFRETRALIHLSYEQLRQRVENLERRDQN